ncbi:MAG: Mur ligase family protein, partial [Burkholderiaceae bacterium]
HPTVAATAALAARVVGLDIAGVDLVAEDITRPLEEQRGAIIEVNAGPGLLSHLKPADGEPRPVGEAIVDHLFAPDESGRIPVVGVTGTQGTTLITRLVAWFLQLDGKYVGLACGDGLYLNNRQVVKGNSVNWETGQRLLINRSVEVAVFENCSRMILTEGLAYDKCSVGIVTDLNGHEELGEFYIHEQDQLYNVVRTQVDVVLPNGVAVLNAADPHVVQMAALCDGKVIFYGLDPKLEAIEGHRSDGERAVFMRDNSIVLTEGHQETALIPLSSFKSNKSMQPESIMAATAAAWALGIAPELIVAGLKTFDLNPGKTNY